MEFDDPRCTLSSKGEPRWLIIFSRIFHAFRDPVRGTLIAICKSVIYRTPEEVRSPKVECIFILLQLPNSPLDRIVR